ncbi:MAG TPA: glycosyltransferase family 4 protein, partial [Erysipelothrix sp.]|nr:glycosyltransferase family 4 protein [Erysipelothrix sp.]
VSGYFWKLFTKIKADYVFIFEVSPMTQALPGVWYAKKRKIPCYLYVQDLWPENVEIVTGISNKTIIGSIGRMVDYIYRNCDKIFTTSRSFIASISARGIERDKLEFWPQYAEEFYKPLNYVEVPEIDSRKFNVTFTGNVGQAQGLDILIEVAKEFINENVKFNLIGDGRYKEELIIKVKNAGVIDLFNFIPRQEPTHIPKYLAASQVVFLSLSKNKLFEMTIPAKLQSYFACGKPVLASISGESASIIKEANAGYVSEPGGVEELVNNLKTMLKLTNEELSELGRNARKYYLEHFEKNMLLNDMDKHFELKENKYV